MPSTPLRRLQRYHDLLLLGGGFAVTFVAVLVFAVTCVYALRQFVEAERQQLLEDRTTAVVAVRAAQDSLRRTVSFLELSWPVLPPPAPGLYETFRRNGHWVAIGNPSLMHGVYFAASGRALEQPELIRRNLALAQLFSATNASVGIARDMLVAGYVTGADGEVVFAPLSNVQGHGALDVAKLIDALRVDFAQLAPGEDRRVAGTRPAVYWLPPFVDPLSGERRLRIVSEAMGAAGPFAAVTIEYDPQTLFRPLMRDGSPFLIVAPGGEVVTSFGSTQQRVRAAQAALHGELRHPWLLGGEVGYGEGCFVLRVPVSDTQWSLVHVFSRRDVADGIARPVGTAATAMALIVIVVWTLLLTLRRRIFTPLLYHSARVFESEHLSRTLVHTVPAGLGLIARASREWLLRSPLLQEMAARIEGGEQALAEALAEALAGSGSLFAFDAGGPRDAAHGARQQDLMFRLRDGGHIELACSASAARYKGADAIVAVFIDVTQRRLLQRQLNAALEAADSANQAKSAFLAAMSHEIRTPLNAILGNLELLADSPLTRVQRDRLATVRSASDGLLAVISDILDFSKIEAGEMTLEQIEFDVLDVIEQALVIFQPLAQARGLALYARLEIATRQTMWGDPARVRQVLNNLLSNAIKFTEHGSVTVIARIEEGDAAAPALALAVADTGIGISDEQRARLFKAFSQLDVSINRRFGGTGLGLALCQRLVQAMHGDIGVASTPGAGSRFTVRLPLGAPGPQCSDERFLAGKRLLFLSSADEWTAFAVPHLVRWGADVEVVRHPQAVVAADVATADALVIWGSREQWQAVDENRLVEEAAWVIDGYPDGPVRAIRSGKVVSVSSLSLSGLAAGVRAALLGEPLEFARPVVLEAGALEDDAPDSAGAPPVARGLKVLVAEDNAANRMLLAEQLSSLGCTVTAAANGRQALDRLADDDWDLLLTDLNMPGMSGYELAESVRERRPALPIVAITAHATREERLRCEAAGMARVMTKPVSLLQLREAMCAVAAGVGVQLRRVAQTDEAKFGDKAIPQPLWDTFIESVRDALVALDAAQTAGDVDRVLAGLHSLRGALSVYGQAALAAQCAAIEREIRGAKNGAWGARLQRFRRALGRLAARGTRPKTNSPA